MTDTLRIEGLKIETRIGVHDWEQKINQLLRIDIELPFNFKKVKDDIKKTIDYDAICQHVTELTGSQPFRLIETVAETIASSIQTTFGIKTIKVCVSKPHAIANAANVSVEIFRD